MVFNGKLFNTFIEELIKKLNTDKQKICLFLDNAIIHKTKNLQDYITTNNINVFIIFPICLCIIQLNL